MFRVIVSGLSMMGVLLVLASCAPVPPRPYYGDNAYYGSDAYYYKRSRYDCSRCGVVDDIRQVYVRNNATTGGGAVIGAIIGGVLGSTIGKGDGRTAATVAGAVAGGFAGNAVERNSNGGDRPAWQFRLRMDNGRHAVVTQWNNPGLRVGDHVMIRRDDTLILLR
ncbi:MAG: glycine zipper 2TM domain-containing protein [Lysobacterales bacterium]